MHEIWYSHPSEDEGQAEVREHTVVFLPVLPPGTRLEPLEVYCQLGPAGVAKDGIPKEANKDPPEQHQRAHGVGGVAVKPLLLSLDGLLDYDLDDCGEKVFEVSLFGEKVSEFLQREHGRVVCRALLQTKKCQDLEAVAVAQDSQAVQPTTDPELIKPKRHKSAFESGSNNSGAKYDNSVMQAFKYFDVGSCGYIRAADLEAILYNLDDELPRRVVHNTVCKISDYSHHVNYLPLCMLPNQS